MEPEGPNAPQKSDPVSALGSGWVWLVHEAQPALQAPDTGCLALSTGSYFLWARLQSPRPLLTKACEVLHAYAPRLCSTPSQAQLSPPKWPCSLTPQPLPQSQPGSHPLSANSPGEKQDFSQLVLGHNPGFGQTRSQATW